MKFSRTWAMPTSDTFDCKPIGEFVRQYLKGVSVDPFARNKRWATHTNDLNPDTRAEHHMDAESFHERTKAERQYEKKRDRFFTTRGFRMLRFTGSEIFKDPYIVAVEIIKAVSGDPEIVTPSEYFI